jgi:hypothetical protein
MGWQIRVGGRDLCQTRKKLSCCLSRLSVCLFVRFLNCQETLPKNAAEFPFNLILAAKSEL